MSNFVDAMGDAAQRTTLRLLYRPMRRSTLAKPAKLPLLERISASYHLENAFAS
jgi:hypothetical protein